MKYRIDEGNYKNFVYRTFVIMRLVPVTPIWEDLQVNHRTKCAVYS
jgi:hypothetical protein